MPFNTLLLTCLHRGTSFSENGKDIRVDPLPDEIFAFFIIDDQSNPKSKVREEFGITGEICDLLVFRALKNNDKKIICLVELKGNNIDKAIDQVMNTYKFFGTKVSQMKLKNAKEILDSITWKAYIRLGGSAPVKIKDEKVEQLNRVFKGKNNFKISRDKNLGYVIRES